MNEKERKLIKFLDFLESSQGQVIAEHLAKKMQAGELPPLDEFDPADFFNADGTIKDNGDPKNSVCPADE